MGALANTFYLIKHDLESKAMNNVDMREVTRSMDYEPSTILNDKLTAEIYPYTQTLSQINNSKAMDTLLSNNTQFSTFKAHQTQLQRQIETLKNELNLTSKVKSTLELQLQEYRKQNTNTSTKDKQLIDQLSQDLLQAKDQLKDEIHTNDRLNEKVYEADQRIQSLEKQLLELEKQVSEVETEIEEKNKQIAALQKPSLEQMKREVFAAKSKQREKDTQINDLKDRILALEKENDKAKEIIKELKKDNKEMKQDLDLRNKQSFKLVQSERDELEDKLRQEIQQRQQDAQKWFSDKLHLENALENLRTQNNHLIQTSQQINTEQDELKNLKAKGTKYKKKNLLKNKKIQELEQKLQSLENEKEEYRIKYSNIQSKTEALQRGNEQLTERLSAAQTQVKELEFEIKLKQQKYDSLGHREAFIRVQHELDDCQKELVTLKSQRDHLSQQIHKLEAEKSDVKSDNIKMCQIIREYEAKVTSLENNNKNVDLTVEAKLSQIKLLQSEIKQLQNENSKLCAKAEEYNTDCEKLTKEYKILLDQISDYKAKEQKQLRKSREDSLVRQEQDNELRIMHFIADKEKYAQELDSLKESYERTISIQKETMRIFSEKVDEEIEILEKKLSKSSKTKQDTRTSSHIPSKERDRLSDILREVASKEANLKAVKAEAKTLRSQVTKLKQRNKELSLKVGELKEVIDSNPRTKRMLEKQKGKLNNSYTRLSSNHPLGEPAATITIGLKEYNEVVDQNIALKIENSKLKNSVEQLEELNSKLEGETEFLESENERLKKRCDNLIEEENRYESKQFDVDETKLKKQIMYLNEELEEVRSTYVPVEEFEEVQKQLTLMETKLHQVKFELDKKKEFIKQLQIEQDYQEYESRGVGKDYDNSENYNINKHNSCSEKTVSLSLRKGEAFRKVYEKCAKAIFLAEGGIINTNSNAKNSLNQENKALKPENTKTNLEIERLQAKLDSKNEQLQGMHSEIEHLREAIDVLEAKNSKLVKVSNSVGQLEDAIRMKDEIITKLKSNLDTTIEKFNLTQSEEKYRKLHGLGSEQKQAKGGRGIHEHEYTLGPQNTAYTLENVLEILECFFENAPVEEIDQLLMAMNRLFQSVDPRGQTTEDEAIRNPYFSTNSYYEEGTSGEGAYFKQH